MKKNVMQRFITANQRNDELIQNDSVLSPVVYSTVNM